MSAISVQYAASSDAPTTVAQGLNLNGLRAYRVIVSAAEGQTLAGAGTLECYLWSDTLDRWMRAQTSFDISVEGTGRDYPSEGDLDVLVASGRVYYATNGVTGAVLVTIEGVGL